MESSGAGCGDIDVVARAHNERQARMPALTSSIAASTWSIVHRSRRKEASAWFGKERRVLIARDAPHSQAKLRKSLETVVSFGIGLISSRLFVAAERGYQCSKVDGFK